MTLHSNPNQLSAGGFLSEIAPLRRVPLEVLRAPQWSSIDWLRHGFSARAGGVGIPSSNSALADLNLGYTPGYPAESVASNRRLFLNSICSPDSDLECKGPLLITLKQMHSSLVRRVGRADAAEQASLWGDGLMTDEPGVYLGIQTADCLPILMADKKRRAVAAFHAGWRGTLKGIVELGVASMRDEFGSQPIDLIAAIGPGIGSCCFFVGAEIRDLFTARFAYAKEIIVVDGGLRLDLAEANRRQLLAAGLLPGNISLVTECTSCRTDRFFSYRAERGKTGRMMAVIGVAAGR